MIRFRRSSSFRLSVASKSPLKKPAVLRRATSPIDPDSVAIDVHTNVIGAGDFSLSWQHISAFPEEKEKKWWETKPAEAKVETKLFLNNVTGTISSGNMLVVLGRFAAGKSLLLKILSGMKVPGISYSGQILLDGHEIMPKTKKFFAYLPSHDSFFGALTVEEHLKYQALLNMDPSLSMELKMAKIDYALNELDLTSCKKTLIGIPGHLNGITAEQQKKLVIATKLLLDARILMCDYPASNLDPSQAYHLVSSLKKIACNGKRIIICSFIRPPSEIYSLFDHLLILHSGRVVFMGCRNDASEFFKSLGMPSRKYFNPTDHFMHTIAHKIRRGREGEVHEMCNKFRQSAYYEKLLSSDGFKLSEFEFEESSDMRQERVQQSAVLSWIRLFSLYKKKCTTFLKRDPMLTTMQITHGLSASFFMSATFWGHDKAQGRMFAMNSLIFIMIFSSTVRNLFTIINALCRDINIFIREQGHSLFKSSAFYLARSYVEFWEVFPYSLIFITIMYWCVGFEQEPLIYTINALMILLVSNVALSYAHFMACLLRKESLASLVAFFSCVLFAIYGGFLLHHYAMPIYSFWLRHISWFWYSYEIILWNQWMTVKKLECHESGEENHEGEEHSPLLCINTGHNVIHVFGFGHKKIKQDVIMLFVLMGLFRVLSFISFLIRVRLRSWEADIARD